MKRTGFIAKMRKLAPQNLLNSMLLAAALFMAAITLVANVVPCTSRPLPEESPRYDPALSSITTLNSAEQYIRAGLPKHATDAQTAAAVEDFVQRRFVHGYADYQMCDNWIGYILGGFYYTLRAPIDADEILNFNSAFCTQATLVLQGLLGRFGIEYATIMFMDPLQHMAAAAKIDGEWALYDGDLPINRDGLIPFSQVLKGDILERVYKGTDPRFTGPKDFGVRFRRAAATGNVHLESINHNPGQRGMLFQKIAGWVSDYGWLLLLLVWLLLVRGGPLRQTTISGANPSNGPNYLLNNGDHPSTVNSAVAKKRHHRPFAS